MPSYMTRVELHDANYLDYENLHQHMQAAGFKVSILGGDGIQYRLPPAEYYFQSDTDYTASQIRDHARQSAQKTGKENAVVTCKTDGVAWIGLKYA